MFRDAVVQVQYTGTFQPHYYTVIGLSANSESNLKKKANMTCISVEDAANFTGFQIITL